jgi:hypothetical protein
MATYFYYEPVFNPLVVKDAAGKDSVVAHDLFLNRITGEILYANDVPCLESSPGVCDQAHGKKFAFTQAGRDTVIEDFAVTRYPVGRYTFVDLLRETFFPVMDAM